MNKREFFRMNYLASFEYKTLKFHPDQDFSLTEVYKTDIINLSGNGLVFRKVSEYNWEKKDFIYGNIFLSKGIHPIKVLAKVIREIKVEVQGKTIKGIAITFKEITMKDQDLIVKFLNQETISIKND